jgi:hypothetical protein
MDDLKELAQCMVRIPGRSERFLTRNIGHCAKRLGTPSHGHVITTWSGNKSFKGKGLA